MSKRTIIILVIAGLLLIGVVTAIVLFSQKKTEEIPTEQDQYVKTDPDTGNTYTVNGVHSGETFDAPWVYGQYSLKKAGLPQDFTVKFSEQLSSYVVDTYKDKFKSIEILTPYITVVQPGKEYALKMRLGDVTADNAYLYASVTILADNSLHIVLKDEKSTVLQDVTVN